MDPVAFHLCGRAIRWYGVFFSAGFLAVVFHWMWLARREGRPADLGPLLALVVLPASLLGARLAYVLTHLPRFTGRPEMLGRFDAGGMVYYGGLIAGVLAAVAFARYRREPVLALCDFGITGIPLGLALVRIGCFLNGCCYGIPANLPWAVKVHGAMRHPVPLYESTVSLAIYATLLAAWPRRRGNGWILGLYFLLYGAWRFLAEFLRGEPRLVWAGLSSSQWVSLALLAAGALLAGRAGRAGERAP